MPVGKSRSLTDFEKNLKEEIYKRDNHIDNSVKYAIDTGQDYGVSKDTPQWRRDAINKYRDSHKVEIYDDDGNLVGTVGYEAHKAINKNKVFDYKGKNDEEKRVFSYLRQRQNREARKKEQREYYATAPYAVKSKAKKETESELFPSVRRPTISGETKNADVLNFRNRTDVKNKYNEIEREASKHRYSDNKVFTVPITQNKKINVKYGVMKKLDGIASRTDLSEYDRAKKMDEVIDQLGLSDDEKKNARSYAGIKKLELSSASNGEDSFLKEITQPIVKFLAGTRDAAESAARFFLKDGMKLDGSYTQAYNEAEKYYTENPDELGNDLFDNYKQGLSTPEGEYLRNAGVDKILEAYNDTTKASQFISDAGFRSAGQMAGDMALVQMAGVPNAMAAAKNIAGAAMSGTKAADTLSKVGNIAPKIKEVSGTGKVTKAANTIINGVNSVSVGKAVKFLNPLDNPTTALMGISAAQDKYSTLKRMGYDDETAKKSALFSGYVSTITEKMGYDGKPESFFLHKGNPVAGSATASKAANAKKVLKDYLKANVSEGVEEIYNTVFDRAGDYFSKIGYVDENGEIKQRKVFGKEGIIDPGDIGENFLGGFVGGAVMGSTGVLSNIAQYDVKTVREYADDVRREVAHSNKVVTELAKEAGVENVNLPSEPNWEKASVDEINDYYSKAIDAHLALLNNEKVINHDAAEIQKAKNLVITPDGDTARQSVSAAANSGNSESSVISSSVTAAANVSERQMHDVKENLSEGGAAQSVEQVQNAVKKVTNTMINEFKNSNIKNIPNYQAAYDENLRLSTTKGATIDKDFIKTYADQYAEGLKHNNSKAYKELASVTDDVGSMLTDYLISNRIPQGIGDISALAQASGELRTIVGKAANTTLSMNGTIYNDMDRVSAISSEISNGNFAVVDGANDGNIALSKVGEYYEAYGTDAVALAKAFGVSTHYIQKNGRKTLVAAVPVRNIAEDAANAGYRTLAYTADGREFLNLTKDAEPRNANIDTASENTYVDSEGDNSFIESLNDNEIVLDKRPSDSDMEAIAISVELDNSIPVILDGVEKLGEVMLDYSSEEDVSRNMVKSDINSYYDGIMPERGIQLSENINQNYDEDAIEISERPSDYDIKSYAMEVEIDNTIPIYLNGVDTLGKVELDYSSEENVTQDMVKADIDAYYSGTMPEHGVSLSNNYDPDIKFSVDGDGYSKQLVTDFETAAKDIMTISDYSARVNAEARTAVRILENTPNVILDNIEGSADLPIVINFTKMYLAARKSGVIKGNYHNLGSDILMKLPQMISDPDMILQLGNGRLNLLSETKTENGNNAVVSIELNSTKDIEGKNKNYNVVVTLFSANDNYVRNLINKDGTEIKYTKEDLSQVNPRLYNRPATFNDKSSIDNISQNDDIVNSNIRENSGNNAENAKNLVAIHNSSAEKLSKTLDLGGFAMPSIAITKNNIPHENFGDISVVFKKETVDPKTDKRNKVYSADAWTPTFPNIEYEANPDVVSKISEKRYDISKRFGHDAAYGISKYSDSSNVEDKLNRYNGEDGVIKQAKNDIELMKSFLYDAGIGEVEPVKTETTSLIDKKEAEMYDFYIQKLGKDAFEDMKRRPNEGVFSAKTRWMHEYESKMDEAFSDYIDKKLGITGDEAQTFLKEQTRASKLNTAIRIRNYIKNGSETVETKTDISATNEKIKRLAKENGFDDWVAKLFGGIENDSGMYNGIDPYTDLGDRKSFKQTHYEVTLENIVKAMQAQGDGDIKNVSGFVGIKSLRASLAKTFNSIADMHKTEGRLENLSDEAVNKINDNLSSRLSNIISDIYNTKEHGEYANYFIDSDQIGNILVEACELKEKSAENIKNFFNDYQYNISNKTAKDIVGLLFDVTQMPVRIFEAKPERVVGIDEVAFAVMPEGKYPELKSKFESKGIEVKTYDPNIKDSRLDVINSEPDIRFSQENSLDGGGDIRYNDDIYIPYRESKQLREYIMSENNRNGSELKPFGKTEIGDNFYVWRNNNKTDYDVVMQIEIDGNEDVIDLIRKELDNGETHRIDDGTKRLAEIVAGVRDRRNRSDSDNARNTAELSNGNDDRLYSRQSSDDDGVKFARESGRNQQDSEVENYGRDDILNGNDRRTLSESERERNTSVQEITGDASGNASEEQSSASTRGIYARDVKEAGGVERRNDRGVEADFVKSEYYNDEMRRIAAENDERGVVTHFILGNGRAIEYGTNFRGAVRGNEVYIQADHGKYSPTQINRHEIIHRNYSTDTVQELKNRIKSRLTNEQIRGIAESLYRDYAQKRRSFDEIFEEFVCDVLADMNEYTEMFDSEVRNYWAAEETERKGYSPSTYRESIDAGGKNVQNTDALSVNTDFLKQVDLWKDGLMDKNEVFNLGNTPDVLKNIGADSLPMIMTQKVMNKITGGKHDIDLSEIKRLPQSIAEPIMIFKSATTPNAYVILTELSDKNGNSVIAALHLNRTQYRINVNRIASVYGKENIENFVRKQTEAGNLIFADKNKSQQWSTIRGLQLPKMVQSIADNTTISQNDNDVNSIVRENSENDTDIRFSTDENTDVNAFDDEDMSYLSEPVRNIRNDINEVINRADLKKGGKVYDRVAAVRVRDSILDNISIGDIQGIDMRTKKDRAVMTVLVNRALNSAGVDAKRKSARDLTRYIAQNASVYDADSLCADGGVDYEGDRAVILNYIKHGVKISPDAKEALISAVGEKSAKGYIAMMSNNSALGIDSVYDELSVALPGYFTSDALTEGEKMRRVIDVYTWLKDGKSMQDVKLIDVMTPDDARAFTELVQKQLELAFDTMGRDSAISREIAAERTKYEQRLSDIREKYEAKIADMRNSAKKRQSDGAKAKNISTEQTGNRFKNLAEAAKKYGAIKKGANAVRDIEMPKRIDDNRYVSRFARTMAEAGVTPDEALSEFEKRLLDGEMTYERITDEEAKESARSKIERRGFLQALDDWNEMIRSNQRIGKNEMALGQTLYNQCINAKDAQNAMKIAADLANIATQAGQTVQACMLIKQMSPDCQLYSLEQSVEKMKREFENKRKFVSGEKRKIDLKINEELAQKLLNAKTEDERRAVMDEILQDIANQIPSTLKDKWDSWRYLSMLGNPRTHIRNIGGNAVFMLPVKIKNSIGWVLEKKYKKRR